MPYAEMDSNFYEAAAAESDLYRAAAQQRASVCRRIPAYTAVRPGDRQHPDTFNDSRKLPGPPSNPTATTCLSQDQQRHHRRHASAMKFERTSGVESGLCSAGSSGQGGRERERNRILHGSALLVDDFDSTPNTQTLFSLCFFRAAKLKLKLVAEAPQRHPFFFSRSLHRLHLCPPAFHAPPGSLELPSLRRNATRTYYVHSLGEDARGVCRHVTSPSNIRGGFLHATGWILTWVSWL